MPQISLSEEAQADADSATYWYIDEGAFIAAWQAAMKSMGG